MIPTWLVLLAAAAGLAVGIGLGRLFRTRGGGSGGDLSTYLDRLENVLRRDPHRDDIRALYADLVERAGPAERKRRLEFLDSLGAFREGPG